MFRSRAPIVLAVALAILVASDDSLSNPQEILGRSYSREAGRLFKTDHNGEEWDVAPGVILVRFASSASAADILEFQESNQIWPAPRLTANAAGYRQFRFATDRDPLAVLNAVAAKEMVQDACLDTEIKFFGDPYFANQWNLQKIRADKAWEITRGDSLTVIAIIDGGVDYLHEDLVDGTWRNRSDAYGNGVDDDNDSAWYGSPMVDDFTGWDFRSNDNTPLPDTMCIDNIPCNDTQQYHGTSVAGVALAICDNDIGVAGACGARDANSTKLMTLRLYMQSGSSVADAIEYAWRKGATVVNMSFGINDENADGVAAELDRAAAHGVIVVAAVGNTLVPVYPASRVAFPASYPSVMAVGATDENDLHWPYSCVGPELDFVAPSGGTRPYHLTELWTTDTYKPRQGSANPESCGGCPPENDKYYSHFSGTSAASPEVASVAALLKSHRPGLTATQVRQRLIDSAVDLGDAGPDTLYGYGRVDAYRALTEWGTITGNVTWRPEDTADSTRYVSGDLTIAAGAMLTILPGTIIKIANDDDLESGVDQSRIEINVEGTLVADGTAVNPIVFESWHPTTTEDWVGFYFDNQSGGGTFDNCDISRAEYAIESYKPLSVTNTRLHDCRYVSILSQDGGGLIRGCNLTNPGSFGIFLTTDSTVVRNTVVDGATDTALNVQINAAARVCGSEFKNSNWGFFHRGTAHAADIDSSCSFQGNDIGVNFFETNGMSSVGRSTISDNGTGIWCEDASPLVTGSQISSCVYGVVTSGTSQPDIGHHPSTGGNKFGFNDYHVYNDGAYTVYAQNNCWNRSASPCGPPKSEIYGSVLTTYPECCTIGQAFAYRVQPQPGLVPRVTSLGSIVPNPFNPMTTIHFDVASTGVVEIGVYDVGGRLVRGLVKENQVPGQHEVEWRGVDSNGQPVASGVYFVRMIAGGERFTKKMVLLK